VGQASSLKVDGLVQQILADGSGTGCLMIMEVRMNRA
jgi:hypothetical protein